MCAEYHDIYSFQALLLDDDADDDKFQQNKNNLEVF